MPDMNLLESKIKESGITKTAVARKAGMVRGTLYNRLNNVGEWTVSEVDAISKVLRLTKPERDKIFFN